MKISDTKKRFITLNSDEHLFFDFRCLEIPCLVGSVSLIFDTKEIDLINEAVIKLEPFFCDITTLRIYSYIENEISAEVAFEKTSDDIIIEGKDIIKFFEETFFTVK